MSKSKPASPISSNNTASNGKSVEESHAYMAKTLAKDPRLIASHLVNNSNLTHLLHMAVGISGEAGELLDAIKKLTIYAKPYTSEVHANIIEELGDIEFYMQELRRVLDLSRADILIANMNKLQDGPNARYSEGYSDEAAEARADKASTPDAACDPWSWMRLGDEVLPNNTRWRPVDPDLDLSNAPLTQLEFDFPDPEEADVVDQVFKDLVHPDFEGAYADQYTPTESTTSKEGIPHLERGSAHYTAHAVQPWAAMQAWFSPSEYIGFLKGNVVKYNARHTTTGNTKDLDKAQHYATELLRFVREQEQQKAGCSGCACADE